MISSPLLIILIIAAYFGVLLIVSHTTSVGATNNTYFTGNRNMAWPIVALAMVTAPISGLTFISVPGMVATKGFAYLQMCMGFVVGYLLIGWVLVPLFYKHNIISIYSFLDTRFGKSTYKTGAWLFLISEVLGIGVRFMVVCIVLQMLVFSPLNIPFVLNVLITMTLIWLYTARGGVKSVIWSDTIKSLTLLISVVLCFYFISSHLGLSLAEAPKVIMNHSSSHIFNFDDVWDPSYFWKQFLTGVFIVVAMTGLDQDMMQRVLACKNYKDSRKNLAVSGLMQFLVITLFLSLGVLLLLYMERHDIPLPQKTDDIFATVAYHSEIPFVVSVLFILGIVSASYSSVGSALTSLTTSYTVDIMEGTKRFDETNLHKKRKYVHACMALIMCATIILCYYINEEDAITALFTLASYTYGPILGLFVFGVFSKREVIAKWVPLVCVLSPILSWMISIAMFIMYDYTMGYELFLLNSLLTLSGLFILSMVKEKSGVRQIFTKSREIVPFLIITFGIGVSSLGSINAASLKTCDLIFELDGGSDFSQAITDATTRGDSLNFVHVGIIEVGEEGVNVIEASPKYGVRVVSLNDFMTPEQLICDSLSSNIGEDEIMPGKSSKYRFKRLNMDFPADKVIDRAKSFVGQPYDWWYLPDNGKMYCSELVYESFLTEEGERIFESHPMNFQSDDGTFPEFWVRLFEELGDEIPQGKEGTNPNDLWRDSRLIEIE